jgi:hypothetical protein
MCYYKLEFKYDIIYSIFFTKYHIKSNYLKCHVKYQNEVQSH